MNQEKTVNIEIPRISSAYKVIIQPGIHSRIAEVITTITRSRRYALICDDAVADGPGGDIELALSRSGCAISCVGTIKATEKHKSLNTVTRLLQMLADAQHERNEPIIAIGGGITGDMAGFAAAVYHRGTPFINIPTTLLAMVDASVGGKTGVNLTVHSKDSSEIMVKNLIGAFYQPTIVLIDTQYLNTLPVRQIRAGFAECVKHAVLADENLFSWMADNVPLLLALDQDIIAELVKRNIDIKAAIVMEDEREQAGSGGRALLNLGHTFAHALETSPLLDLIHGEAVALGMIAATHAAISLGRCDRPVLGKISNLLDKLGLPNSLDRLPPVHELIALMHRDKKVREGEIRLVLPVKIGKAVTADHVSDVVVEAALRALIRS